MLNLAESAPPLMLYDTDAPDTIESPLRYKPHPWRSRQRCAAAAGECRPFQHDISDRHRHTLRDGVGVIGLGGADHQLINIAADRAGWGFKVGGC